VLRKLSLLVSSLLLVPLIAVSAEAQKTPGSAGASGGKAKIGAWGYDLAGADNSVKAGNDFYAHANGKWTASNFIPADRTAWGTAWVLDNEAERDVRAIIDSQPANAPRGSTPQKVGDFYRAYLDTATVERLGIAPAKAGLDAIAAARTHEDVARLLGRPDLGLNTPVNFYISVDEKNPDRYIIVVTQGGLGLPDREYYLKDEEPYTEIRAKYEAHIGRMLGLAGQQNTAQAAKDVLAAETAIAKAHWPVEKRRERELTYNLRTREELKGLSKDYPWDATFNAAGLQNQREFVVSELDAIQSLADDFVKTPVEKWRSYMTYHYLVAVGSTLGKAIDDERFDFYGRTLNGQPQQRDRWKRAVQSVNDALGEAVGQLYVQKHFPPDSKAQMLDLVENLRKAYAQRIRNLPWMSADTKKVALEKLAAFRPKIGYPDKWRDYSALEVRADDAFGNATRARVFEWNRQLSRLGKPTDREEWEMTPQTVNAYYNPVFNEIVFPAAILQAPYFDPNADPAINYGTIGGVIGHEMGHGFDDQGSKSDAKGVLRTWWVKSDEDAFKKLGDNLAGQYDAYEALPGLKLNGRLTLGENIGDVGGLSVAYEAYKLSLKGKSAPVLDGLTGDQRFFLAWAQGWRTLMRDARLRNQVMSDPHSPALFRVNGVVRNMDAWYAAFDVKPGDKLYLPPDQRVRIW